MKKKLEAQLEDLIRESHGEQDGLRVEDLWRAEDWIEKDGTITFLLERHPHVLGWRSSGQQSSFFRRQLMRYRFDGHEIASELLSSTVEWDVGLLVVQQFDLLNEADAFVDLVEQESEPCEKDVVALLNQMSFGYSEALTEVGAGDRFDELWSEFFPAMTRYTLNAVLDAWAEFQEVKEE